jgi:putative ABC transport system permease protein
MACAWSRCHGPPMTRTSRASSRRWWRGWPSAWPRLDVYDEVGITPEEKEAWIADRQGAIIGDLLASKFNWKAGDVVRLVSGIYPGDDYQFRIKAIYKPLRKSAGRDWFLFDWDYLNENAPSLLRDQVGWITARVEPGLSPAEVSKAIDAYFDEQDVQTLTQDEAAYNQSFVGMFTTILGALNIVSIVILGIMMLILGNTVAMGVRERTREYGALRALGFMPAHVTFLILGEAATLGLAGGLLGLALAVSLIGAMGAFIEENMSSFFPIFRLPALISLIAVLISVVLGLLSAAVPALSARRLKVVEALRHTA